MSGNSCPPPPSINEKADFVSSALNSLGGNQKCRNIFNNALDTNFTKVDAAMAVLSLGGAGAGTLSLTNNQTRLNSQLEREGCSDIFANISQQIQSTQNILCELNKSENITSLSGSARATINITPVPPTREQERTRRRLIDNLYKPEHPVQPQYFPGEPLAAFRLANEAYQLASSTHQESLRLYYDTVNNINGGVKITDSTITLRADVDMRVISDFNKVSTTKIVDSFKAVAKAQALSDLKQKTGYGANPNAVKSLVANKINNRNQDITNHINNDLQRIKMVATSATSFSLQYSGSLSLNNVKLDEYAHTRLIASSIMSNASNMGKEIAVDIFNSALTSLKSDQTSTGVESLLAAIGKSALELSKANSEGAAKLFGQLTSFLSMGLIGMILVGLVALMFLPNLLPGKSYGIIGIVVSVVIIYLIASWFLGWFPFSKSNLIEHVRHDFDKKPENTSYSTLVGTGNYISKNKEKKRVY